MLANHLQNGIESARLVWSQIPNSEESHFLDDAVGLLKKSDGSGVDSLDYEVIENFAYREEQAHRGKLYVSYLLAVKWFFALLIGIGRGFVVPGLNGSKVCEGVSHGFITDGCSAWTAADVLVVDMEASSTVFGGGLRCWLLWLFGHPIL